MGCGTCADTGYRGRTAIYEVLLVDDEIRRLVVSKTDASVIKQAAVSKGMSTLREEAAAKVLAGITTTEEAMRITQSEVEM